MESEIRSIHLPPNIHQLVKSAVGFHMIHQSSPTCHQELPVLQRLQPISAELEPFCYYGRFSVAVNFPQLRPNQRMEVSVRILEAIHGWCIFQKDRRPVQIARAS